VQRNWVTGRALVGVHGRERSGGRFHVTGAQVVEPSCGIVLLSLEEERVATGSGLVKVVSHLSRSRVLGLRLRKVARQMLATRNTQTEVADLAACLAADQLGAAGVVGREISVRIVFREDIGQRAIGIDQVTGLYAVGVFRDADSVAVIAIGLEGRLAEGLDDGAGHAAEVIVVVRDRAGGLLDGDLVAVRVVGVRRVGGGGELVQFVIGVGSGGGTRLLGEAVAHRVVGVVRGARHAVRGDGLLRQAVEIVVGVVDRAVLLDDLQALAGGSEGYLIAI